MTVRILKKDPIREGMKDKSRRRREGLAATARAEVTAGPPRNDLAPDVPKEMRPAAGLKAPDRRVRKADPAQRARVKSSIQTFGFVAPILIAADGTIIDGLTRWEAASELGLDQVPCLVVDHLTEAEIRLLTITLNRLGETGGWELEALKLEFDELIQLDLPPLEITGFAAPEIDNIRLEPDADRAKALDAAPELQSKAVSQPGDVWILGRHRLICGDARDPLVYEALMSGEKAQFLFTDEPYNVPVSGHVTSGDHREFAMASGEMSGEEFLAFNVAWMDAALPYLNDGALLASFIDWRGLHTIEDAAKSLGLKLLNLVVWEKTNAGQGSLWRSQHELLPVFKLGSAAHINNVELGRHGRWRSNVWTYPGASSPGSDARAFLKDHPTPKPVAMLEDGIIDVTNAGDLIIEPFCGSGSTLIAAETTARVCRAIEYDPLYVDLAVRRWMALTGEEAVLEETGATFSEVAEARARATEANPEDPTRG